MRFLTTFKKPATLKAGVDTDSQEIVSPVDKYHIFQN
mgnify:CR=1 FL=1